MLIRRSDWAFVLAFGAALPCAFFARDAAASTFDKASGKLTLDGAYSSGFDDEGGLAIQATDMNGATVDASTLSSRFLPDTSALEGTGAFFLGGDVHLASIDLGTVASTFSGHRVETVIWLRPGGPAGSTHLSGTSASIYLEWHSGSIELSTIRLLPTGRGTSDGWREYSSGPVDFALAGKLPPAVIIRDENLVGTVADPSAEFPTPGVDADPNARIGVDALEVRDLGPALVIPQSCNALNEATTCGAGAVCYVGTCADAGVVVGPVPQNAGIRSAFVDRVRFEMRTFEGGRYGQSQMSMVDAALATAATMTDPQSFWSAFDQIHLLEDAHSAPPRPFGEVSLDPGICFGLGTADLLPGQPASVPMVYHTDPTHGGAANLEAGDVLTAVDGVPVETWVAAQNRFFYLPGDPRSNPVYEMLVLPSALAATGAKLTFSRCDRNGHSSAPCAANEVETITVDLAATLAPTLWNGTATAAESQATPCDPRFTRPIDTADSYDYTFAGSVDLTPDTRVLVINGVPAESYTGGEAWKTNVTDAVSVARSKFLLDERMGNGGWSDPAFPLLFGSLFDGPVPIRSESLPFLEGDDLDLSLYAMRGCWEGQGQIDGECAEYMRFAYDGTGFSMDNGASKLAILAGLDVSGNDYLTRMIRTRTAPTRMFGVVPTMGGYGKIYFLPGYGIAPRGGSVQVQDTIFTTSDSDPNRTFESADGVVPDEIDLEKQSDAILGVDTLYTAALNWTQQ